MTPEHPTGVAVPDHDLTGALPGGLHAIEASAGTGKTYALAALATRYVAEHDVPASGLCIVTFTEAATAELRGRIRERFVTTATSLVSGEPHPDDAVARHLAAAAPDVVAERAARLRTATDELDTATIVTIHGFCGRVLAGAGAVAAGDRISADDTDVVEVVHDAYLARFADDAGTAITPGRLVDAVRARLRMPGAELWRPSDDDLAAAKRKEPERLAQIALAAELTDECLGRVLERRASARRRTFDGLLTDTAELLASPRGDAIVAALRDRYRVVLVDEFQDTDQVQWSIFRRAFVSPVAGTTPPTTVIVGDPKQAIYRFRAAELSAYLDAVGTTPSRSTLTTNWRSDPALLDALEALFARSHFGDERVGFRTVAPAPDRERRRIHGLPHGDDAALELRCVPGHRDDVRVPWSRRTVRHDVVRAVAELLSGATTLRTRHGERAVRPGDIAVLTKANAEATQLALDLGAAGIAAATSANNSVLDSPAARQWQVLLHALERPNSTSAVRAAALSWFVGDDGAAVDRLDDRTIGVLHERMRRWADALTTDGIGALHALIRAEGLHARMLTRRGGERDLTDLEHVAELLRLVVGDGGVTPSALMRAMSELDDGVGDEAIAPEQLARRIDRDDDAVQILTVHRSKGLQFPVVLCPYLWTQRANATDIRHGDPGDGRVLDTAWIPKYGPKQSKWTEHLARLNDRELDGEARRLIYVALTRAQHHCIAWWAPPHRASGNPLDWILRESLGLDETPSQWTDLRGLDAARHVSVRPIDPDAPVPELPPAEVAERELDVADGTLHLDGAWRIWSFSALTSMAEQRRRADATDELPGTGYVPPIGGSDEPSADADDPADPIATPTPPGLLDVPGGTAFGTLVHGVLERVDFAADDLDDQLLDECTAALRFRPLDVEPEVLARGLRRAIDAPLGGPLADAGTTLGHLRREHRLDELAFDLRLGRVRADAIGRVLAEHLPDHDPFRPWASDLARHGFEIDVAGMLTGSIDLVARAQVDGTWRYWVADHKTNRLGEPAAYAPDRLPDAMTHHHYPLQAALYLVATHRYLRWRLGDAHADEHLLGASYLFLRGMDPARAPGDAHGVCWWRPPAAAIHALDRLLAGASAAEVAS